MAGHHPAGGVVPNLGRNALESIIDHLPDALLLISSDYKIVFANQAAAAVFGYAIDELLDQAVDVLVPERFRATHGQDASACSSQDGPRAMGLARDIHALRKDGSEFPAEIHLNQLPGAVPPLTMALVRDATPRKQLEHALRDLNDGLERQVAERTVSLEQRADDLRVIAKAFADSEAREVAASRQLTRDLDVARKVQRDLVEGWKEVEGLTCFAHLEAARMVSGDFYDVTRIMSDPRLVMCSIGDVVGKGVSAALMMSFTLAILREQARLTFDPDILLQRVSKRLRQHAGQGDPRCVSVAAVTLDVSARTIRYATAGHLPILAWRRRDASVHALTTRGLFLGALEKPQYRADRMTLDAGDKLLLYTDGIPETRNAAGEFFGEERLLGRVRDSGHAAVDELGRAILADVASFRGSASVSDDLAMLVIELS